MHRVVVIQGITGQDGSYLAEFLLEQVREHQTMTHIRHASAWYFLYNDIRYHGACCLHLYVCENRNTKYMALYADLAASTLGALNTFTEIDTRQE